MVEASRTLNPLHFEDLEPRRFEDLVRQLIYDFRFWKALEATGRSGGDSGFDVRGFEIDPAAGGGGSEDEPDAEEASNELPLPAGGRVWLIQCKREKTIGPTKLKKYLEEIPKAELVSLHGIIFVAAADFSLKSRDIFRQWCSKNKIQECFIWGRGELEDALYQPKNDNILFAYFGVSIVIRRRSQVSKLRSSLTIKRKLKRIFDKRYEFPTVVRSIDDAGYPWLKDGEENLPYWKTTNRWRVMQALKLTYKGLELKFRRFFAFIDDKSRQWDIADGFDDSSHLGITDPWALEKDYQFREELRSFWSTLDESKRGFIETRGIIRFDNILEVDEIGDDWVDYPHIFVSWDVSQRVPFDDAWAVFHDRYIDLPLKNRVVVFPAKFRIDQTGDA